jgi:hypothetical protein
MSKTALLVSVAVLAFGVAGDRARGQSGESPLPELMSATFGWQPVSGLDFEPVEGRVAPVGRHPALKQGEERRANAEHPNLTPWAAAKMRANNEAVQNGHRFFMAQSRCWPGGVPNQLLFVAQPVFFIQTPTVVWIIWERDHHVRRVFMNREHSANVKPTWFGESVGRYENGELVIDTIGLIEHELSVTDSYATPHTNDLHVVERWKILNDGKTLEATVIVEDKGAFKAPWSGKVRWEKANNRSLEEWVCAENNLGYEQDFRLKEYPMPVANTPDF